jgi:hypothetical protein
MLMTDGWKVGDCAADATEQPAAPKIMACAYPDHQNRLLKLWPHTARNGI